MENKQSLTKLYPIVQIRKDTWEIDEFDVASLFLLIGTEKAMLIDTAGWASAISAVRWRGLPTNP